MELAMAKTRERDAREQAQRWQWQAENNGRNYQDALGAIREREAQDAAEDELLRELGAVE